ncbi:hypothetical protein EN827_30370 [Mesorhizobium sp. M1D.F.Ca.ET.184.01.1.1]|nr:hypothetical protein EN874_030810 [Mesorhizobium sp. M1D.F.Ca.ET.231.01.1.1]TGP25359.1 hypothetical protein EN877_30070 [Mesorhizobium sp. M1D.F.Ca.ET.234.01.1.1]TGS37825.1 hypothetical protein EN827_30370 [Mesorhizobium sp. M1D.F.Ca.ET.184.01.1.1]TGS58178.1 hypothetical protein EN826_030345 [Mesorhizobium sp. M1D.F.Ca.ET.183.01.1.1]
MHVAQKCTRFWDNDMHQNKDLMRLSERRALVHRLSAGLRTGRKETADMSSLSTTRFFGMKYRGLDPARTLKPPLGRGSI